MLTFVWKAAWRGSEGVLDQQNCRRDAGSLPSAGRRSKQVKVRPLAKGFGPSRAGARGVAEVSCDDDIPWLVNAFLDVEVALAAAGARTLRSEARA